MEGKQDRFSDPKLTKELRSIIDIIYEDEELLVIRKPAGLVCHPSKGGPLSSLVGRIRLYLNTDKPIHFVNRLDAETSGIVVVAKNLQIARRLRWLWERRAVRKIYWAIVHGHMKELGGIIKAPIGKDETSPIAVKATVRADGAGALTYYKRLQVFKRPEGIFTLVQLEPVTGRKHQLRVHLAWQGYPIVGDKLYGVVPDAYLAMVEGRLTIEHQKALILPYQALLAKEVQFEWDGRTYNFKAQPEPWFIEFLSQGEKIF